MNRCFVNYVYLRASFRLFSESLIGHDARIAPSWDSKKRLENMLFRYAHLFFAGT